MGPAYISAALAYGWQDVTTDRTVTVAGFDQLRAEFNANAYSGRIEGGYRFVAPVFGGIGLTPYAAGQFTTFDLPNYAEQAVSAPAPLHWPTRRRVSPTAAANSACAADKSFAVPDGIFTLRGRSAWAYDYNPDRNFGATFQTLPGRMLCCQRRATQARRRADHRIRRIEMDNGWSAAATFEGEFSNVTSTYAGKGVVRYAW